MKYIIKCSDSSRAWYYTTNLLYDDKKSCWENSLLYAKHMKFVHARIILCSIITNNTWKKYLSNKFKLEIINVK